MKYFCSVLFLIAGINSASAQIAVTTDNNTLYNTANSILPIAGAAPVSNIKYIDLTEGSPFFQAAWAKGKLISKEGAIYNDISVKLNLMEGKIHYLDGAGKELIVGTPLSQLIFPQSVTGKNIHFINGEMLPVIKKGWYQLLVNDSISLLKGFVKEFQEHTSYGSAPEYSIKTTESYIAFYKGQEYEIKKPVDILSILPGKKAEIESFLKKASRSSKEEQLSNIIIFANSLLK